MLRLVSRVVLLPLSVLLADPRANLGNLYRVCSQIVGLSAVESYSCEEIVVSLYQAARLD